MVLVEELFFKRETRLLFKLNVSSGSERGVRLLTRYYLVFGFLRLLYRIFFCLELELIFVKMRRLIGFTKCNHLCSNR